MSQLPLIEVEYLEGELRRSFEREPIPSTLVYFDEESVVHRLELTIRNANDKLAADYPLKLTDCSLDGAHAVVDHKYRPGGRLMISARSAKSEQVLFRCVYRIMNRHEEIIELESFGEEEDVFTFGTLVDNSMTHDIRRVFHYGLKFLPAAEENTADMNLLYKSYLDTLYIAFRLSAMIRD